MQEQVTQSQIPSRIDDSPENLRLLLENAKQFNSILIQDNRRMKDILNMVVRHFIIGKECTIDSKCCIPSYLGSSEEVSPNCYQCITNKLREIRNE